MNPEKGLVNVKKDTKREANPEEKETLNKIGSVRMIQFANGSSTVIFSHIHSNGAVVTCKYYDFILGRYMSIGLWAIGHRLWTWTLGCGLRMWAMG